MNRQTAVAGAMGLVMACAAMAQPRLVVSQVGNDLGYAGNTTVGWAYDAAIDEYAPFVWTRGAGYFRVPDAHPAGSSGLYCSADGSALAAGLENATNWGDLNCFNGYDSSGALRPPVDPPCPLQAIAHRWTPGTGWVNAGSIPRFIDPGTGRWVGGTRCDFDINAANDISADGRYIVGGAWNAEPFNQAGGVATGLCGGYAAFRYDGVTGAFEALPVQAGTRTARADRVNADGSTITGYDLGPIPDGQGGFYPERRMCVWSNGVQTILDPYGNQDSAAVNGPGNIVAASPSIAFGQQTWGLNGRRLVKWTRQANGTWTPQNLGRPVDRADEFTVYPLVRMFASGVSDDGNTIVGHAWYGSFGPSGLQRAFIWRPSINGGVPIDLQDYLATIDSPSDPILVPGMNLRAAYGLSGNGNALLLTYDDGRNTCVEPSQSHVTFGAGILYMDGAGVACDPPRIGMDPRDWVEQYNYRFGSALNVLASGSWPLNYQWQREDPMNPGTWVDLVESCMNFDEFMPWDYEGVHKPQLRVNQANGGGGRGGRYRVVVSNSCGSVTSEPATLTFRSGACCLTDGSCSIEYGIACGNAGGFYQGDGTACEAGCAPMCDPDVNCDGSINGFDIEATEQAVNGDYSNFCQASTDFNRDGAENGFDVEAVEQAVNGAPCP